jgi:hypothetical protein
VKTLHTPEACLVILEHSRLTMVRWRNRPWSVMSTLEVYTWHGEWWTTPDFAGERREYHLLATKRGEIEVFLLERLSQKGWFVSRWFD